MDTYLLLHYTKLQTFGQIHMSYIYNILHTVLTPLKAPLNLCWLLKIKSPKSRSKCLISNDEKMFFFTVGGTSTVITILPNTKRYNALIPITLILLLIILVVLETIPRFRITKWSILLHMIWFMGTHK